MKSSMVSDQHLKFLDDFFKGNGSDFPGLIHLIRQFLDGADVDVDTRCTISQYLAFIQVSYNTDLIQIIS